MQLTSAIIGTLLFILGSAVLLAIAVGLYFWDERKRLRKSKSRNGESPASETQQQIINHMTNWQRSQWARAGYLPHLAREFAAEPRGLGNEQGKLRAALRKARRAGPSDQSGDDGGHPIPSEPFWRER